MPVIETEATLLGGYGTKTRLVHIKGMPPIEQPYCRFSLEVVTEPDAVEEMLRMIRTGTEVKVRITPLQLSLGEALGVAAAGGEGKALPPDWAPSGFSEGEGEQATDEGGTS